MPSPPPISNNPEYIRLHQVASHLSSAQNNVNLVVGSMHTNREAIKDEVTVKLFSSYSPSTSTLIINYAKDYLGWSQTIGMVSGAPTPAQQTTINTMKSRVDTIESAIQARNTEANVFLRGEQPVANITRNREAYQEIWNEVVPTAITRTPIRRQAQERTETNLLNRIRASIFNNQGSSHSEAIQKKTQTSLKALNQSLQEEINNTIRALRESYEQYEINTFNQARINFKSDKPSY